MALLSCFPTSRNKRFTSIQMRRVIWMRIYWCTRELKCTIFFSSAHEFLLFFHSSPFPQASEIQFWKNQCEQEKTQLLTILLWLENPRLTGFMLIGTRWMFLETDGKLTRLYNCPRVHQPLQTMNQCSDRIPILHKDQIQFIEPSPDKLTQSLMSKTARIELRPFSNSMLTRKTLGTRLHLVLSSSTRSLWTERSHASSSSLLFRPIRCWNVLSKWTQQYLGHYPH